ncbi:MAG: hypothetical protein AAB728_05805 [Patescibacteria group bacterium]
MSIERDEFGNMWPEKPPVRSDMTATQYAAMFHGCLTVAVNMQTDEVVAGGNSEGALREGFARKKIDPASFQLEPGPFTSESLDRPQE